MELRTASRAGVLAASFAGAFGLLAAPATAQLGGFGGPTQVATDLYHRVDGDQVRVVLEVQVDDGFHVYHPEVGPGFALGTTVTLTAPGVTFGDAVFPVPDVEVQEGLGDGGYDDTFVWGHHGTFQVLAVGRFDGEPTELLDDEVQWSLVGQVCDINGCLPWEDDATSEGAGEGIATIDSIFAEADWGQYDAKWPYPLATLEPTVMEMINGEGDAQAFVRAEIAAYEKPAVEVQDDGAFEGTVENSFESGDESGGALAGGGFGLNAPQLMAYAEFFHRVEGDEVRGVLRFEVDEGYHLYHPEVGPGVAKPTAVTLTAPGVTWNEVVFPEPEAVLQPFAGEGGADTFVWGHHDTFVTYVTGTLAEGASAPEADDVEIAIVGQTCNDEGCVDYDDLFPSDGDGRDVDGVDQLFADAPWATLYDDWPHDLASRLVATYTELGIEVPADLAAAGDVAEPADDDAAGDAGDEKEDDGLMELLLLAIGGGLFALVMPCTYPMIPITISFFTKQAEARDGHVWPLAIVYGAGITAMFTAIGLGVFLLDYFAASLGLAEGDAGSAIIAFAISGWFNLIIGVMFVYFALVLFGAINLNPPQWALRMVGTAQGKGGIGGLFLMGFLLVVTSFTCTGPFVGSILGAAAQQGGTRVLLGMFVFGLTLATPFVLLSLVPGKVSNMPKAGAWMNTVKITLGFVEIAAALKFFSNVDLAWEWGVMPREMFLLMWAVIAFVIASFLFGQIKVKGETGEIGPGRMSVGAAFVLLGTYFGYGGLGNQLGGAMSALAPPYSARIVNQPDIDETKRKVDSIYEYLQSGNPAPGNDGPVALMETGPVIVKDDLEAAAQKARDLNRGLLINFTGHI